MGQGVRSGSGNFGSNYMKSKRALAAIRSVKPFAVAVEATIRLTKAAEAKVLMRNGTLGKMVKRLRLRMLAGAVRNRSIVEKRGVFPATSE